MSHETIFIITLLVFWTITAPVATVGGTTASTQSGSSTVPVVEGVDTPGSLAQIGENETLFEEVETNSSSFVVKVNMSLFTTLFQPGSVFRIVTGGTANGERVVWFDIGIGRGSSGFVVHSEMSINLPYI